MLIAVCSVFVRYALFGYPSPLHAGLVTRDSTLVSAVAGLGESSYMSSQFSLSRVSDSVETCCHRIPARHCAPAAQSGQMDGSIVHGARVVPYAVGRTGHALIRTRVDLQSTVRHCMIARCNGSGLSVCGQERFGGVGVGKTPMPS